jgi:excisionase family DNA binding protein
MGQVVSTSEHKFLSPKGLAEYFDVPVRTIYAWRYRGEGPPIFKVGRHIRYKVSEVDQWLESQRDDREGVGSIRELKRAR